MLRSLRAGVTQLAPAETGILFAQTREDVALDLKTLARAIADPSDQLVRGSSAPISILVIASGGCTPLSLLAALPTGATVDAVDVNPDQMHLVRLKAAAIARLDTQEDIISFLCGTSRRETAADQHVAEERRPAHAIYEAVVRDALPASSRDYWDDRASLIDYGVNQGGRYELLFRRLAPRLHATGLDPGTQEWDAAFEVEFERDALAADFTEPAVSFSMSTTFAKHFSRVFGGALERYPSYVTNNYFLHQAFHDDYPPLLQSLPPYMTREGIARLKEDGGRRLGGLRLFSSPFDAFVGAAGDDQYDFVGTSNITDWMSVDSMRTLLADCARVSRGCVIGRRLNGDHVLEHEFEAVFGDAAVDASFNADLLANDRSFFYSEVVAAVGCRNTH